MFIKSLKLSRKQNNTQILLKEQITDQCVSNSKKKPFQDASLQCTLNKKSRLKYFFQHSAAKSSSNNRVKDVTLMNFENQYIKYLTSKQAVVDQRRQQIKERIKDKVKQKLADLIKRSRHNHSSLASVTVKEQILDKSALEVSVRGNSVQRSLRGNPAQRSMKMSLSHKPELQRIQKIKRTTNKQPFLKQFSTSPKPSTAGSSSKQNKKGRRSLSNVIRLHNIGSLKDKRSQYNVLAQINFPFKKDLAQIQPWHNAEEY